MRIKQSFFSRLFYNNKFLLIFSIFVSFCIWVFVASGSTETITKVIDGIPIEIPLSDEAISDGLEVFSQSLTTAQVRVTGNRAIIGSISQNDIQVFADSSSTITRSGSYTLALKAKKVGQVNDYEITSSISPSYVYVVVDKQREITLSIEPNISYKVNKNYFASTAQLSTNQVTIKGPESDISKISKAVATGEIKDELSKDTSTKAQITLLDSYGTKVSSDLITMDVKEITVNIPVLLKKTLPIDVEYLNKPDNVDISNYVTIEPSTIDIAASEEVFKQIGDKLMLRSVDFSRLVNTSENVYDFNIELPAGCKNLNQVITAKVTIDFSSMALRTYTVTNFEFKNLDYQKKASVTKNTLNITLLGNTAELNKIQSNSIKAIIDLSTKGSNFIGTSEISVSEFDLGIDTSECWVIGDYTTIISVESKSSS